MYWWPVPSDRKAGQSRGWEGPKESGTWASLGRAQALGSACPEWAGRALPLHPPGQLPPGARPGQLVDCQAVTPDLGALVPLPRCPPPAPALAGEGQRLVGTCWYYGQAGSLVLASGVWLPGLALGAGAAVRGVAGSCVGRGSC